MPSWSPSRARRRDGARVDLAAGARGGVGGRARCRVWRNGTRVVRTPIRDVSAALGATSTWALRGKQLGHLPTMRLSWVCCGVDYPHLLDGDCDHIIYTRSNAWDHLPGTLMVAEAGGAFGQADGSPYTRRSDGRGLVVAADPQTYAMLRLLAQEALTRSR